MRYILSALTVHLRRRPKEACTETVQSQEADNLGPSARPTVWKEEGGVFVSGACVHALNL